MLLLVTETMGSYQSLSPSIFLQADYDVSKLLSNTDSLEGEGEGKDQLITQTLQLISGAPRGALRWHHQVCIHILLKEELDLSFAVVC